MLLFSFALFFNLVTCLPSISGKRAASNLIVSKVPDHVRPYVVRAYALDGYRVGSQIYRFPVTGPSSDYAFTLISTAAPASTSLGVLPHVSTLLVHLWWHLTITRPMQAITKTFTALRVDMLFGPARTTARPVASSRQAITVPSHTTQPIHSSSLTPSSSSLASSSPVVSKTSSTSLQMPTTHPPPAHPSHKETSPTLVVTPALSLRLKATMYTRIWPSALP